MQGVKILNVVFLLSYQEIYIEVVIDQGLNFDEENVQEGGLNICWNERVISMLGFY